MSQLEEEEEDDEQEKVPLEKKQKKVVLIQPKRDAVDLLLGYNPNYLYTKYSGNFYSVGVYHNSKSDYMFDYTMTNAAYILHKVLQSLKTDKSLFTGYVPLHVSTAMCSITSMKSEEGNNKADYLTNVSRYKGSIFRSDHVVFYLNMYIEKDQKYLKTEETEETKKTKKTVGLTNEEFMLFATKYYEKYVEYNRIIFQYIIDKLDEKPNVYQFNNNIDASVYETLNEIPSYKSDMLFKGKHVPLCLSLSMLYYFWQNNQNIDYDSLHLFDNETNTNIRMFLNNYPKSKHIFTGDIDSIKHEISLLNTIVYYTDEIRIASNKEVGEIVRLPRSRYDTVHDTKAQTVNGIYTGKQKKIEDKSFNNLIRNQVNPYTSELFNRYTRTVKEVFERAVEVYIVLTRELNARIELPARLAVKDINNIMYKYKNDRTNTSNNTVIYVDLCGPYLEECTDLWLRNKPYVYKQPFLEEVTIPEINYVSNKNIVDDVITQELNKLVDDLVNMLINDAKKVSLDELRKKYEENMRKIGINNETMPLVYNFLMAPNTNTGINPDYDSLEKELASKIREEVLFIIKVKNVIKKFVKLQLYPDSDPDISISTDDAVNYFNVNILDSSAINNLITDISHITFNTSVDRKLISEFKKDKENKERSNPISFNFTDKSILKDDDEALDIIALKSQDLFYSELYDELVNDPSLWIIDDTVIPQEKFISNQEIRVLLVPLNLIVRKTREGEIKFINIGVDMKNAILERKLETTSFILEEPPNKRFRSGEEEEDPFKLLIDLPLPDSPQVDVDLTFEDVEDGLSGISKNLFTHLFIR